MERKNIKKLLLILLALLLLAQTGTALAYTRYKRKRIAVTTNTALVLPARTWVTGIGIYASSAGAEMGIYDSATLGGALTPTDEVGEATQYNRAEMPWPEPIFFEYGVTVIVRNGVAFVEYQTTD